MEIIYCNGNLLDAQTTVIGHQVNCQGVMGSGVAKQIKEKWPGVFPHYQSRCRDIATPLGDVQLVKVNDTQYIANIFGQFDYGTSGERYTSYDALDIAFNRLKYGMVENNLTSIAIPYKMSSDRGGADWDVVLALLKSAFSDTNIRIEIWKYDV